MLNGEADRRELCSATPTYINDSLKMYCHLPSVDVVIISRLLNLYSVLCLHTHKAAKFSCDECG